MSVFSNLTSEQLRKAAVLKEKISKLEKALADLIGAEPRRNEGPISGFRKKKKISAAGIARIKAAQKLRWAKYKLQSGSAGS